MRCFSFSYLLDKNYDLDILKYISLIHEAKGRQQLFLKQKAVVLDRLIEIAKIQSTQASNEIEGIRTTQTRIKQLVEERTAPRDRAEKEISGYRDALNVIHESFENIPLTPNYILQLHKILYSHVEEDFGGKFKNVQNYIKATRTDGHEFILFTPIEPFATNDAMRYLCDSFNIAIGEGRIDPLILIPIFIHDFLCIHPFIDGNGRMSRLLTTLLLYRNGYFIGRYISLENKIEKTKDYYFDALEKAQDGWHENQEDAMPFVMYLLGVVLSAYRDFEDRVDLVDDKLPVIKTVRNAVKQQIGKFRKSDILEYCSSISTSAIERALKELCDKQEIEKLGGGRSTYYVRKNI